MAIRIIKEGKPVKFTKTCHDCGCEYDPSILPKITLVRYQTEKRSLLYTDYCRILKEHNRTSLLE